MDKQIKKNTPTGSNYLGLVFQMGVFIFLATYGGMRLDKITGNHYIFVVLFSLLSVAVSLYYIIHKVTYKKKKDE
jgi:membrane protein DedA with SNARE-associated domain